MSQLFEPLEPYRKQMLDVGEGHSIYLEECGNPKGRPILVIHGGPGAGCSPWQRQFFDPAFWRIILFDQRGSGRSLPYASLDNNTTWHLVSDIEKIRNHLSIDKWHLFGGSWGSTLALSYAVHHPSRCSGLILRGIFLLRPKEIDWFYQSGCSHIFPDYWEDFVRPIPSHLRGQMISAYYDQLTSDNPEIRRTASMAWSRWEGRTVTLLPAADIEMQHTNAHFADAFARIECHYFINQGFFDDPNYILSRADALGCIPIDIVHGRYDIVCPLQNAWDLHRAAPHSRLHIIEGAGHSATEPAIQERLVAICERVKNEIASS